MTELLKQIGLSRTKWAIVSFVGIVWVAVIIASGAGWNPFSIKWSFTNRGAFGDSFAPISTMMALVAALGAIGAYQIQSNEVTRIRIREEELDRITQSDRARSVSRQEILDQQAERQNFETTFFQLLKNLRELVAGLDLSNKTTGEYIRGHDVFRIILQRFTEAVGSDNNVRKVSKTWKHFSYHFKYDINHYFRTLYHVVKFVDRADIDDKYFYIQILRASLSEGELALLALNCDYGEGREKFKELVEKYALLHNLSDKEIKHWKLRLKFKKGAFERQADPFFEKF